MLRAPEEVHVVRGAELQQEVHMEARADGLVGLAPLRDQHRLGIALVKIGAHVLPEGDRRLLVRVVLDERARHINAKAVCAPFEPERHDVLHGLAGRERLGAVDRALPRLVDLGEAIVEGRLEGKEVDAHRTVALRDAAQHAVDAAHVHRRPDIIIPHVAAGELILAGAAGLLEPGVLDGGVPGHEVEQHVHAAPVARFKQADEVVVGAVARGHAAVIRHIVAGVAKGRDKTGVEPEGVYPELLQIVELLDDAGDIADAVVVGVVETLRIDFVEDGTVKPRVHVVLLVSPPR